MRFLIAAGNARLGIADGRIADPSAQYDAIVTVPDGEVRSGLINAHDHLRLNHFGQLGHGRYANAYDWAADVQSRHADVIAWGRALPRRQALLWGAWKNLLSGVTAVVHHDTWETDFKNDFPLRVIRLPFADSLGMTQDIARPPGRPFALHVAEGVDTIAASEIRALEARGWLDENLLAVHAVGADADGVARLRASGGALIWCPTSNRFLFGSSAPPALLAEGMDVLLGSDSLLTGAGTLLDEIQAARGIVSDTRLLGAVGPMAARRFQIEQPPLTVGAAADLVLLRRPLLEASLADVVLVMAQGALRVLAPELLTLLQPPGGQMFEWRGVRRWISEPVRMCTEPPRPPSAP